MASRSVIAVQGYTLRDSTKTPADIAKTLARVKKIGYDAIQVSAFGPIDPKELAKMLHNEGLVCCATHTGFERMQSEPERVAEEHHVIGCRHTAPGSLPASYRSRGGPGYVDFTAAAGEVARTLAKLGLTWSYHNHHFEFERFNGRRGLDIIFEDGDPKVVNMELDTYWVQYAGADPAAWIRRCKGRVPLLHLKDLAVKNDKQVMAEVGEGNLNWPAILEAAREAGVEWYIVEQDDCGGRDPFESVAISLENLKRMGLS